MPTKEEVLEELENVLNMIYEEHKEKNLSLTGRC